MVGNTARKHFVDDGRLLAVVEIVSWLYCEPSGTELVCQKPNQSSRGDNGRKRYGKEEKCDECCRGNRDMTPCLKGAPSNAQHRIQNHSQHCGFESEEQRP